MAAIVEVQDLVKNYYMGDVTVNVLKGLGDSKRLKQNTAKT